MSGIDYHSDCRHSRYSINMNRIDKYLICGQITLILILIGLQISQQLPWLQQPSELLLGKQSFKIQVHPDTYNLPPGSHVTG